MGLLNVRIKAILVDIDGTLANSPHVNQFMEDDKVNWDAWLSATAYSTVHEWCREIVNNFAISGYKIVFLTARNGGDHGRKITNDWLRRTVIGDFELYMRTDGDYRPDYVIKKEIFIRDIAPKYDVSFALDDKKTVIDMWRELDIPALHCADY